MEDEDEDDGLTRKALMVLCFVLVSSFCVWLWGLMLRSCPGDPFYTSFSQLAPLAASASSTHHLYCKSPRQPPAASSLLLTRSLSSNFDSPFSPTHPTTAQVQFHFSIFTLSLSIWTRLNLRTINFVSGKCNFFFKNVKKKEWEKLVLFTASTVVLPGSRYSKRAV